MANAKLYTESTATFFWAYAADAQGCIQKRPFDTLLEAARECQQMEERGMTRCGYTLLKATAAAMTCSRR